MLSLNSNIGFLLFLYFIQGLPYGFQARFMPIYLRTQGVSLTNISLFKLLLIPWLCKALWAPLIDLYATKRQWLLWSTLGLSATCVFGACINQDNVLFLCVVLFMLNVFASTQDIVVDSLAVAILKHEELGKGNTAQVVGYKFGTIFGGGVLVWFLDWFGWTGLFLILAILYLEAVVFVYFSPIVRRVTLEADTADTTDKIDTEKEGTKFVGITKHIKTVFSVPGTIWMTVFVLVYKLGENGVLSLIPLFLVDRKVSLGRVSFWTSLLAQGTSILGSLSGGALISKYSLPCRLLLQQLTLLRLVPTGVALVIVTVWSSSLSQNSVFYCVIVFAMNVLSFLSGTVTTVAFTFMMQCSQKAPKQVQATHYSTLATLEVLGKLTFGIVFGFLLDSFGYSLVTLICCILVLVSLFWISKCPTALLSEAEIYNEDEDKQL